MAADVVILCGGRGIRMLEETEIRPKPMVEIGGKPVLWHIMKYYASFGFRRFILALGYKGDMIAEYFHARQPIVHTASHSSGGCVTGLDPDEINGEVICVNTGLSNLKGSRIKQLESYLSGDNFHLTYGDGLCNVDLRALDTFHHRHRCIGTVTTVRPPSRFGELTLKGDRVTQFEEKPQMATGFINGGFFVFQRAFLDDLTPDTSCDFEFGALQRLAAAGQLRAYKHEGFWQCMDTVRERDYLNELYLTGCAAWKVW